MRSTTTTDAINAAHERIVAYLAGARDPAGQVPAERVEAVVDRAFAELRQVLDAAAGLPPQR